MVTTIKLFLKDGTATGRIKCSFSSGWNGIAYKIPYEYLNESLDIDELKQAGVYFLFGYDEKDNETVYVGQANIRQNGQGVLWRISEPHGAIPEWKTCVVFVSNDNSIGPTELNYLENKFTTMALDAHRYVVKNRNTPNPSKLREEELADMDLFIMNANLMLSTLGFRVFEPYVSKTKTKKLDDDIFTYKFKGKIAYGKSTNEGFVLLKDSQLVPEAEFADRWKDSLPKLRKKYADKIDGLKTTEDILFRSSSKAGNFCSGQSISGPKKWINKDNVSLYNLINNK